MKDGDRRAWARTNDLAGTIGNSLRENGRFEETKSVCGEPLTEEAGCRLSDGEQSISTILERGSSGAIQKK
jgi:hypothetical protein